MVETRRSTRNKKDSSEEPPQDNKEKKSSTQSSSSNAHDGQQQQKQDVSGKQQKDLQQNPDEDLSEEDLNLRSELEMLVQRLQEKNSSLYHAALESLRSLIRSSTSSMTSVPKPLKFLRPHYDTLKQVFNGWKDGKDKQFLADILSVLGMTYYDGTARDSLHYYQAGSKDDVGSWGHEYVRHLALELIAEYNEKVEVEDAQQSPEVKQLTALAMKLVPFFLSHNAEHDAVDLLLEIESLESLVDLVSKETYQRVSMYLVSCASYVPSPDDVTALKVAHSIFKKFNKWPEAVQIAMKLNDQDLIVQDFTECPDALVKKQLAYNLTRQFIEVDVADEELTGIFSNGALSEQFTNLAKDLDIVEAKTPEDIYKSHLEDNKAGGFGANVDSARQNLASAIVNAFVNVGFNKDKLILDCEDSNSWIYKNKEHGMTSATASIGLLSLWNVEEGLTHLDKYLYSNEDHVKAGALMGIGLVNCGVRNESDPAIALLSEHLEDGAGSGKSNLKLASIVGLGFAYVGTAREDLMDLLSSIVSDTTLSVELSAFAALSLSLIFVGTCNGDLTSTILQTLMERDEESLKSHLSKLFIVSLGLLYIGKQDAADATMETLKAIDHPISKQAQVFVDACAYAGTGNVLKIQEMLHYCNDHLDAEKEDDSFQSFATLGVAMIAIGEDVGTQMALRQFNHLMHYGEPAIRQAVPLAIGLLCASNPLVNVLEILSKYSHDSDIKVAINAIFAMGLVGAGTNNARLAQMLRQLASYYQKEPNGLFMVRIAQGLLYLGKGTISVNPFHSNRFLMSSAAMSGLLVVFTALLDSQKTILDKYHWMLYYLTLAMYPRFLITLDAETGKSLPVSVRVGQAVDVVGKAGRAKTITGFQTHTTPVLLSYTDRAELATEEYIPLSPILEGFVILKKNPEYINEVTADK
ncbi:hypothetical protein MP228_001629 [Amoeboaphelidium protococcarum]|nr:hypothetical protein MP228_001629 [Amoeboaphelidium protococcarum]